MNPALVSFVCRQLGLDLVPRQEFSMVDPDEISVTELYRLVGAPSAELFEAALLVGSGFVRNTFRNGTITT